MDFLGFEIKKKSSPVPVKQVVKIGGVSGVSFPQADSVGKLEEFLKYYSEDPWVYSACNRIAPAVAEVEWELYRKNPDGERDLIKDQHPIKDLLNNPNPDQTGHDLIELTIKYYLLTGRAFWAIENEGGTDELWNLMSPYVTPNTDPKGNIISYNFKKGEFKKNFNRADIIPFVNTNPLNPLEGCGPVHPIWLEIDMHNFARQFNRNFFYNGAEPGVIISFEETMTQDEVDRMTEKINQTHRGYGRAHKVQIFGNKAKIDRAGVTNRDMQFDKLMQQVRESELGSFGVSYANIGGTENVNRANAEAQNYNFTISVVRPLLQMMRRKFNKFLLPRYGEDLEIDFKDPTPDDRAQLTDEVSKGISGGYMLIDEGRAKIGLSPLPGDAGQALMVPVNLQLIPVTEQGIAPLPKPIPPTGKSIKKKLIPLHISQEDHRIKSLESRLGNYFRMLGHKVLQHHAFQKAFDGEWLNRILKGLDVRLLTLLSEELAGTYKDGSAHMFIEMRQAGIDISNVTPSANAAAAWAKDYCGQLVTGLDDTSKTRIADIISNGMEQNLGADKIAANLRAEFEDMSKTRSKLIARSETMNALRQSGVDAAKEAGAEGQEWIANANCCDDCQENADEGVISINDDFPNDAHPNCLLPGNKILALGLVAMTRAWYSGKAIELHTRSGNRLTVTPNHPILTPFGFMAAERLSKGDHIINSLDSERMAVGLNPDYDYIPTPVEQIWDSLNFASGVSFGSMEVSPIDFHGDARFFKGNVDIVYSDRFLRSIVNSPGSQLTGKKIFNRRNAELSNLAGDSSFFPLCNGVFSTSDSDMSGSGLGLPFGRRKFASPNNSCLATITRSNVLTNQASTDNATTYIQLARNFLLRFASLVATDEIISIREFDFTGHVYNLQSLEQLYISNNIVVKNCECSIAPVWRI